MTNPTERASKRTDQLLADIHNGLGDQRELRTALVLLIAADLAGRTDSPGLRSTSYDGDGRSGRRTEHYVDEPGGARMLTREELAGGAVPDWSITVDPDQVGDAAMAVADGGDQVHDLAVKATQYLHDAANALHAARNTLAAFAQLRDQDPQPIPIRYCRCARWREKNRPPVQHGVGGGTTVGGRLEQPIGLCDDCYRAVVTTAEAGSGEGRLATEDEIRHHDRHGRWPYGMNRRGAA